MTPGPTCSGCTDGQVPEVTPKPGVFTGGTGAVMLGNFVGRCFGVAVPLLRNGDRHGRGGQVGYPPLGDSSGGAYSSATSACPSRSMRDSFRLSVTARPVLDAPGPPVMGWGYRSRMAGKQTAWHLRRPPCPQSRSSPPGAAAETGAVRAIEQEFAIRRFLVIGHVAGRLGRHDVAATHRGALALVNVNWRPS
jgi:hypothetical protein